jgi:preprotein translocase subunit SecD
MNLTVFRSWALIVLFCAGLLAWFLYATQQDPENDRKFRYGLDLVGGSHLVYDADTSQLKNPHDIAQAMEALRDLIDRRINVFGVSEPLVQVEKVSALSEGESTERLIVELPGVMDLAEAVAMIGATPQLEFKLVANSVGTSTEEQYEDTGLTGRLIDRAQVEFSGTQQGGGMMQPQVLVTFNAEGKELFANLTRENVNRQLAIFLDGELKSSPVIREAITKGTAVISGGFTPDEARELSRNLNIGALPIPITLTSTETVGATLGEEILDKGINAVVIGLSIVIAFMMFWYRLPGLLAGLALCVYVVIMLGAFMYMPVTITAAGIAGFILSIGMAVDANVLIFERFKEELRSGKSYVDSVREGFVRAWSPIRDGNFTSLISAIILFWFGTSMVKGFALVFGLGIVVSMFSALVITRLLMYSMAGFADKYPFLLQTGFYRGSEKK